jgi:hypothetical protein
VLLSDAKFVVLARRKNPVPGRSILICAKHVEEARGII